MNDCAIHLMDIEHPDVIQIPGIGRLAAAFRIKGCPVKLDQKPVFSRATMSDCC